MNLIELSEQVKGLDDQQLVKYATDPHSPVPPFLVVAEMQRRKTTRAMNPPPMPQGTVAQEAAAPMQAPMMQQGPRRFASGGLADEGFFRYTGPNFFDLVPPVSAFAPSPISSSALFPSERSYGAYPEQGLSDYRRRLWSGGFQYNGPGSGSNGATGTWAEPDRPYRLEGGNVPFKPFVPDLTREPNPPAGGTPRLGGGIAAVKFPTLDLSNLGNKRLTDAEKEALKKEIEAQYGPGMADKIMADIERQRGEVKGRAKRDTDEAIIKAGLAMMAGRSQYGLQNIAVGANTGLEAFQASRKERENELRALSVQEREAMLQKQRRDDDVTTQVLVRNAEASRERAQDWRDNLQMQEGLYRSQADATRFSADQQYRNAQLAMDAKRFEHAVKTGNLGAAAGIVTSIERNADAYANNIVSNDIAAIKMIPGYATMTPEKQMLALQELREKARAYYLRQQPIYQQAIQHVNAMYGAGLGAVAPRALSFTGLPTK